VKSWVLAISVLFSCNGNLKDGLTASKFNGSMNLGRDVAKVGPNTFAISCRRPGDCYSHAHETCPYGYDVRDSDRRTTGAVATSNKVGNQTYTNVTTLNQTDLIVECRAPVFCTKQGQCAALDMRCVKSRRYPGRAVCADR
jgi:hypothetical protein